MTVVFVIAGILLATASCVTTFRLLAGPDTLDRVVAVDALVAITMGALAVWAAFSGNASVIPGIVALSLIGFVGSTSVARFRVPDRQGAGRADPNRPGSVDPSRAGDGSVDPSRADPSRADPSRADPDGTGR